MPVVRRGDPEGQLKTVARMSFLAPTLLMALLVPAPELRGQDTEWNRYTLQSLPGVYIRAEATEACGEMGIEAATLREGAQSALEGAEVHVMSETEMLSTPGLPDLRITVECARGGGDAAAYSVWVRMQQAARMVRNEQLQLSEAVTWYATALGVADGSEAAEAVEEALAAKMAEFAEAFKAANAQEDEPN